MAVNQENEAAKSNQLASAPKEVLFAQTSKPGMTVGVVSDSELSPLGLLAGGVAGMAARRALRERKQQSAAAPESSNQTKQELNS